MSQGPKKDAGLRFASDKQPPSAPPSRSQALSSRPASPPALTPRSAGSPASKTTSLVPRSAAALRPSQAPPPVDKSREIHTRLAALRNALVHLPEGHETRRALYLAIAEAISVILAAPTRADQERTLSTERAFALFHAREYAAAGQAFEDLDRLEEAERAYTAGGLIEELEYLHLKQEIAQSQRADRQAFEQTLDEAFAQGRRHLVLSQIRASLADTQIQTKYPELISRLSQRQRQLQARCLQNPRVQLRFCRSKEHPIEFHLWFVPHIRIGRSPTAEFQLPAPSLSREHLRIELYDAPDNTSMPAGFMLRDLHTRSGSFLDGDGIDPDHGALIPRDSAERHEIGLGFDHRVSAQVWAYGQSQALALYADSDPHRVHLLCPECAPLFLPLSGALDPLVPLARLRAAHESAPAAPISAPTAVLRLDREFGLLTLRLFAPPSKHLPNTPESLAFQLNGYPLVVPVHPTAPSSSAQTEALPPSSPSTNRPNPTPSAPGTSNFTHPAPPELPIELLLDDQLQCSDRQNPWILEVLR